MSRRYESGFEAQLVEWLDDAARGSSAEPIVAAALARTARTRQRPGWLVPGRRSDQVARVWAGPVPKIVLVAILVGLAVLAVALAAGSRQRRLPPPFGPAASGLIAYESNGHLWLAGPAGEAPHQLTFGPTTEFAPVWSRDGTKLAYRRLIEAEPVDDPTKFEDLVIADEDGSHPVTIASGVPGLSNPTWSPDSRSVAFTRSVDGSPDHLVVAASDGSGVVDLGDLGAGAWGPTWSPDGKHIAVAVANQIAVVDRDGSERRALSQGAYDEVGSQGIAAEWSPDGGMLAFAAGTPELEHVYIVGLDGRAEAPIGVSTNQTDPSWSPDGTMLAYLRSGTGVGPVVVIADRSGRDLRVLPGFYAWCMPEWSPDGRRIIVLDDRPGPADDPGPSVVVALDVHGIDPPIELAAPQGPIANDDIAGGWQRVAP